MIAAGTRIGQFEILGSLGAGGMGEVYRATDTRLGRAVAIKILPEAFARDADRLARFEREAKTLASLNHPNIAQVYGFENGAIVMELLEGETLRERLKTGPLPARKAVEYAHQIARGLAAAHERGIIHRDLKPDNVFVTRDGHVKLLDFGLARPVAPRDVGPGATETVAAPAHTDPGMVMGTVGYMAPEQVRAEPIDARTDLFALGAVLYEMLTGERAFRRDTAAETMTAILKEEPPDPTSLRADLSPALDHIVRHCLEKSPIERFQTARDVAFALDSLSGGGSGANVSASARTTLAPARSRERAMWAAATAILAAAAVWLGLSSTRAPAPTAPTVAYRAILPLPEGLSWAVTPMASLRLAVAPDSRRVAIAGTTGTRQSSIWIVSLTDGGARELRGTEGGYAPYWTPDGLRLSFTVVNAAKMIDLTTDQMTELAAPFVSWGPQGHGLTIGPGPPSWEIGLIRRPGESPTPLLAPAVPGEHFIAARFLPDGRHFLVQHRLPAGALRVELASVDGGGPTVLVEDAATPFHAGGRVLFARRDRLFAQVLDLEGRRLVGQPTLLAEHLDVSPNLGAAYSATDRVVVFTGGLAETRFRLAWMDREGKVLSTAAEDGNYSNVQLSRDERRLAVSLTEPERDSRDIFLVDLARGVRQRLTFDPSDERAAVWAPDGRHVIFNSKGLNLYRRSADFGGTDEAIETDGVSKDPGDVSFDGKLLLFRRSGTNTNNDVWVVPLEGDRTPRAILETPFNENYASFSPDGRSIVYVSDESGQIEVYVMSLEPGGGKVQVSTSGGTFPRWRSPREIVYLSLDQMVTSVPVTGSGTTFRASAPTPLFKMLAQEGPGNPFDVTADGQRFIVNARLPSRLPPSLNVIVNWQALLETR
jgi:dipeptidyl aminopeptidase/acylaminoacyl peptidase/predicted Ser/Thr protein kinase